MRHEYGSPSLASSTHDHSLGLSASTLRYSHLRELWHPTLVPPFHETPRSDVDFSPLVLATSRLREFQCRAPMPLSRESPKSRIPLFSGPTAQLSPFTTVACGTFRRVHITFNDLIGSHHSLLSPRPTGTWYISMCPRPFLEKSNGQIFLRSTTSITSRTFKWSTGGRGGPISHTTLFRTPPLKVEWRGGPEFT
jgi:hypothetical protein